MNKKNMSVEEKDFIRALTALRLEVDHSIVDDIRARYEKAREAQRAAAVEEYKASLWKPIETAPKRDYPIDIEKDLIDLYANGVRVPNCYWDWDSEYWVSVWFYIDSLGESRSVQNRVINPTHWMPLPEPPAVIKEAEEG